DRIARDVAIQMLGTVPVKQTPQRILIQHWRARERVSDRLLYLWRLLSTPTEEDWKWIWQNRSLRSLMPALRPLRLGVTALRLLLMIALGRHRSVSKYRPSGLSVVNRML